MVTGRKHEGSGIRSMRVDNFPKSVPPLLQWPGASQPLTIHFRVEQTLFKPKFPRGSTFEPQPAGWRDAWITLNADASHPCRSYWPQFHADPQVGARFVPDG